MPNPVDARPFMNAEGENHTKFTLKRRIILLCMVLVLMLAIPAVALADTIRVDTDDFTTGNQAGGDLGTLSPGAIVLDSAVFGLHCDTTSHVDEGQGVDITFVKSSSFIPVGGDLSATDTSIGPIPASWPSETVFSAPCGDPPPNPIVAPPSRIAITAPTTPGTYTFGVRYTYTLSPVGSNDGSSLFPDDVSLIYTLTVAQVDADGDGVWDANDNCPKAANPDQHNIDGDGQGDVCDNDRDGDGVANETDNCADVASPGQVDLDGDGLGDVCDTLSYVFGGFFSPVNNLPTLNSVAAGRAIPLKFSLNGDLGLDVFVAGYPKSQELPCSSTVPINGIEETVSAGASSLSYDSTLDQYSYVWKTNKAWAGTCRQLVVKLDDGAVHRANFKFN